MEISDIRDCDCRKAVPNDGMELMEDVTTQQPEAREIFARLFALGLKQQHLAQALDIEANKVSKVKIGERQFKAGEVLKAGRWLDNIAAKRAEASHPPEADFPPTRNASEGEVSEITQLDLNLSMGSGTDIDNYIEEARLQFDLGYIRSFTRTPPERLRIARGVGESMFPTLMSHDSVWIDTSQTALNQQDRIWAVSLFGAAAIKRLRRLSDDRVLVISDNPAVPDQEVGVEDILIGGRIIRFSRDV